MRINIYEEELTEEVAAVVKRAPQGTPEEPPTTFFGVRFYLETGPTLLAHSTPDDDDRNAVTFFVRDNQPNLYNLRDLFIQAIDTVDAAIDGKPTDPHRANAALDG